MGELTETETTVQSIAQEMLDNFTSDKRDNGESFYLLKQPSEWMTDIIHAAHGDRLPNDATYEVIWEVLEMLSEREDDAMEDGISEIEADVYTSDMTAWLASDVWNVYYLDDAIKEYGPVEDGFQILSIAQTIWKQEIAQAVLQGLRDELENREEKASA